MPKNVDIPKIGLVEFPDGMSDNDIAQAAGDLHDKALTSGVSKFMENDPTIRGLKTSEKLKALASIAQMLEKHPLLAQAVDKGMGQVSATSQPTQSAPAPAATEAQPSPQASQPAPAATGAPEDQSETEPQA